MSTCSQRADFVWASVSAGTGWNTTASKCWDIFAVAETTDGPATLQRGAKLGGATYLSLPWARTSPRWTVTSKPSAVGVTSTTRSVRAQAHDLGFAQEAVSSAGSV